MTILGIGLESDTSASLSSLEKKGFQAIYIESFDDAEEVVDSTDLFAVMVDSHASAKIREDINLLLAETPLTTKIVLITHPSDMISRESFQALGVQTIDSSISVDELESLLS